MIPAWILVATSAANTIELDIDGQFVATLAKERDEEVRGILDKFKDFSVAIGSGTSQALEKVALEFDKKAKQLQESDFVVSNNSEVLSTS